MNEPVTKGELARLGMDALDRSRVDQVSVSSIAGGVSFASALEVMEFSKLMACADKAVPTHLRANPGMCLAVTFQAVEWRMSPFAVANKSYVVNDRIAYESQLIHAVIEARAPLKGRLRCRYEGEGTHRKCIVFGTFVGEDEPHEYESPEFEKIKTKNSPLWQNDPDQQFFYYSSRSWARKWCPDVLMGIYSKDELVADPMIGRDDPGEPGLHAKLAGAERPAEGFQHGNGHVANELDQVAGGGGEIIEAKAEPEKPQPKKRGGKKKAETPDYEAYATAWIENESDGDNAEARWEGEGEMRDLQSVPIKIRHALRAKIDAKFGA